MVHSMCALRDALLLRHKVQGCSGFWPKPAEKEIFPLASIKRSQTMLPQAILEQF